jgi:hypothetical protein
MTPRLAQIGFLTTTFLLFASSLPAQTFDQIGERAQGMGGAFVAVADDASAIYWNPAGLSNVFKFDAQAAVGSLHQPGDSAAVPDHARTAFLGAAIPALGLAYYRVRTGVLASGSRQNEGSGEVRVSALTAENFGASLVQTLVNSVVIGATLRAVHRAHATAFDLDGGAIASVGDVRVGLTARNLRHGLDTPRQVRAGVAFTPRSLSAGAYGPFSLAFDADLTRTSTGSGETRRAAIGAEQWWAAGKLGTRAGVHWSTLNTAQPAISGGFTVRLTHLVFVEGHLTKGRGAGESNWGVGARMAF